MNLFKSIDKKFEEIGFRKIRENENTVTYEKMSPNKYIQRIELCHKDNEKCLIHSYDPDLHDQKYVGNTGVGLTMYEASLCIKKMKEKGWKIIK